MSFPWSDVHPYNIPLSCESKVTVFLEQKGGVVTARCHHSELFIGSLMSMVRFLPPQSSVSPGLSSSPSPLHLLPSPWSPGPEAELPSSRPGTYRAGVSWAVHVQASSAWPCRMSPVLSSGTSGTRPLATGHLWSQGHPAQGMASPKMS